MNRTPETGDELRFRLEVYRAMKEGAHALRLLLDARGDEMFWSGAKRKPAPTPPAQMRLR